MLLTAKWRDASPDAKMEPMMNTFRLSLLVLTAGLALSGCGRKNLPVAPRPVTTPLGQSQTPNTDNAPSSTANFQRAARLSATGSNLTVSPAEVSQNPGAPKRSFPLDFLLN
ncbi:MAG: hypothetical protein H7Y08_10625 [Rhizobiaceae bacterium]|nr:hypothetical protein [Rhizobiaceae bacterium]